MAETFEDFVARERSRLHAEREAVFSQQQELEGQLAKINNELKAIDAYESAKTGKAAPKPRARGGQNERRGGKRAAIIAVLADNPHGLKRGEILERLGLKGNKAGEMSTSNALTGLVKSGQVARQDGRYIGQMG